MSSTPASTLLEHFGLAAAAASGELGVVSPVDGAGIARGRTHGGDGVVQAIAKAREAFLAWRSVPAPQRGELIRLFGEELRADKESLGRLVSIETGKILSEGLG